MLVSMSISWANSINFSCFIDGLQILINLKITNFKKVNVHLILPTTASTVLDFKKKNIIKKQ